MIEKWVNFKRDYLEISFLRENCGYDGSDDRRRYLLAGRVFMHKIWPGRRAHWVKYESINNSDLDGMSLASFCQSRAEHIQPVCG